LPGILNKRGVFSQHCLNNPGYFNQFFLWQAEAKSTSFPPVTPCADINIFSNQLSAHPHLQGDK
jgi:hypothetical protein